MRTYAYVRVNPFVTIEQSKVLRLFNEYGYKVQKNRLILEEISVDKSVLFRVKLLNLIEYSLEAGDFLVIKSIDSIGCCFDEILTITDKIFQKKIRLVCLDYSKSEIIGDLQIFFLHFIKLCAEFEKMFHTNRHRQVQTLKKVGRPEILTSDQKIEVIEMYKQGESVYSIAKGFSVTRTVIQRIIDNSITCTIL